MGVEDPRDARCEVVDRDAARERRVDVGEGVGERERHFLHRGRAGVADVVAAARDGIEARQLARRVGDEVDRQAQRRARREDVGAARHVLLEDVVLRRARDLRRPARPAFRATATYIASRIGAVALIVIEVEMRSSGMPSNSISMSRSESIATPTRPTSPSAIGVVGVVAHLRRQVERHREAGLSLCEEVRKRAFVDARRAEAGVLAHGPQVLAVAVGMQAARERICARRPDARPSPGARRRAVRRLQRDPGVVRDLRCRAACLRGAMLMRFAVVLIGLRRLCRRVADLRPAQRIKSRRSISKIFSGVFSLPSLRLSFSFTNRSAP